MKDWYPFRNGTSIGGVGSEQGIIVADEELADGARITLERGGMSAPWAITCGIYGDMVHTRFFGDETRARDEFAAMKIRLAGIMAGDWEGEAYYDEIRRFVKDFP